MDYFTPEEITDALGHRCEFCKQPPGVDCVSIINGKPLQGRRVHHYRVETARR